MVLKPLIGDTMLSQFAMITSRLSAMEESQRTSMVSRILSMMEEGSPSAVSCESSQNVTTYSPVTSEDDDSCIWNDERLATRCFDECGDRVSQKDVYARLCSPDWVMRYVELTSKPFGARMEHYIRTALGMTKASDSGHDAKCMGVNVEIKSARLWAPSAKEWKKTTLDESILDAKFQHLEEKHDFKVLLVVLLGSRYVRCWAIKRDDVFGPMLDAGVVSVQGKSDGSSKEGHWFELQKAMEKGFIGDHNAIRNKRDLEAFVASLISQI